jgi:hypothetical protein
MIETLLMAQLNTPLNCAYINNRNIYRYDCEETTLYNTPLNGKAGELSIYRHKTNNQEVRVWTTSIDNGTPLGKSMTLVKVGKEWLPAEYNGFDHPLLVNIYNSKQCMWLVVDVLGEPYHANYVCGD